MRRRTFISGLTAAAIGGLGLSGCGKDGSGGGAKSLKVAYQKYGNSVAGDRLFKKVKTAFESANPGTTIELIPIEASQNDYFTKLALMNRSPSTAPDVMYQDTYMIRSDVDAGYLAPLDEHLDKWQDWGQFEETAKQAGRADDGQTYGVSMGTDTRGVWFHKEIFAKAGLAPDWQPKSWDDLLTAARAIKAKVPDVIPINVYSGKPMGEASVMQGFEMLLYGTPDSLYDDKSKKWIVGSSGFRDSLDFIRTIYTEGLAPAPQMALDSNFSNKVSGELFPQAKLGIGVDGNFMSSAWLEKGEAAWPEWSTVMGTAPMPTQKGDAPGRTSMSGGWTLAMGANCEEPETAFKFISMALDKENSLNYAVEGSQIAVRTDVGSDERYSGSDPKVKFWTELVADTHFRPATADYAQISNEIMVAMEAVMTGQSDVAAAVAAYDKSVKGIVGEERVQQG